MGKVKILPYEVVSKIAAGEVIERPASVIKELVENALDAHTDTIEIQVKQGGKTFIKIKDSGSGIEPDDIEKIFFRHATSKINTIDDLYKINSLGFRGEALYSIASVSDIILRSKAPGGETGWEIHLRGGEKLSLRPCSISQGTEVEVRQLFFNTPARRKFLKSDIVELNQILNLVIPYAIVYNKCRFSLKHYNRVLLDVFPEPDIIRRVTHLLKIPSQHIIEIERTFSEENISFHLLLGDINIRRVRKDMQFIFVNNRPVQNRTVNYYLNQTYKLILPSGTHPFFVVNIKVPPERVDTNIHPTKREVKIKDEHILISLLRSLCEKTLMTYGKPKQMYTPVAKKDKVEGKISQQETAPSKPPLGIREPSSTQYSLPLQEKELSSEPKKTFTPQEESLRNKLSKAHFIGVFLKKYILFESSTSLLIIDQHAAQERVTYEKLKSQMDEGRIEIQHLLSPILLKLSPQEMLHWEKVKDKLQTIGLTTTLWDKDTVAIHTCPQLIKNPALALQNLLAEKPESLYDSASLAKRACRQSLTAGYEIDQLQAEYLRDEVIKCQDPFVCPHGRPTVTEIQEKILDKQFLRKTSSQQNKD